MPSILSVSQVNRYISLKLGGDVKLKSITVRGELSDFKIHYKSGHAYFTLKDETSQLRGVMFSRSVQRLGFMPQSGMSVLCSGTIEVYEPNGAYQIIASELFPAGIGAKFMQLNALKQRLTEMGIFAQERKKQLPQLPRRVAVVTSLGGAALQDVLNIMRRRYPVGELEVFPAQVQGETAPEAIVSAVRAADESGADVLILTRGGGSFEDLMPFNSEQVALAVAACRTPVISAVGHETDTTLADYAADVRAPTPSAAAEICAPTAETLISALDVMSARLKNAYEKRIAFLLDRIERTYEYVVAHDPAAEISCKVKQLDDISNKILRNYSVIIASKVSKLDFAAAKLKALDPLAVLERGYSVTMKDGRLISSADDVEAGDEIVVRFCGFTVTAKVSEVSLINDRSERNFDI